MPGLFYLADTNILLRLIKSNDPEFLAGSQGCPRTQGARRTTLLCPPKHR